MVQMTCEWQQLVAISELTQQAYKSSDNRLIKLIIRPAVSISLGYTNWTMVN